MFKRIKSPVGEVVSDEAYSKGVKYITEESMQNEVFWYRMLYRGLAMPPFADWLESKGVRLL
jgi:hypothetical protein